MKIRSKFRTIQDQNPQNSEQRQFKSFKSIKLEGRSWRSWRLEGLMLKPWWLEVEWKT